MTTESERFDRLPPEAAPDDDLALSRERVLDWWVDRFAIPRDRFADYTFWERGAGKVWAFRGDLPSPVPIQGLGLFVLRTGGEHWKPTTNAVQRFGRGATRNVIDLTPDEAVRFVAGEDQAVAWDGDWGYLIAAHDLAGASEPLGVGLYLHGELRSTVPKGRRESLQPREG